jgi:hypothetical protein
MGAFRHWSDFEPSQATLMLNAIHDGTVIHDGTGNVDQSTYIGSMPKADKEIMNGSNMTHKSVELTATKKALAEWIDKKQQLSNAMVSRLVAEQAITRKG